MQSVISLIQFQTVVALVSCGIFLYMQVCAYRRHNQKFFLTLAISSAFAIAATLLTSWPYFIPMKADQAVNLFWLSVPLTILATVLGTWGSVQFFRAYDRK